MKLFWAFARQSFQTSLIYRFDFWLRVSTILLLMYSIRWLWIALYAQRPGAFGVSLEQMVTYGVLSMAIENLFYSFGVQYYMSQQVRSGAIDVDLLKPLDFHFHMLARNTGQMLFRLFIMILPAILCGYFFFGLRPPATPLHLGHPCGLCAPSSSAVPTAGCRSISSNRVLSPLVLSKTYETSEVCAAPPHDERLPGPTRENRYM